MADGDGAEAVADAPVAPLPAMPIDASADSPEVAAVRMRVVDFVWVPANELVPHPLNWRVHSSRQRKVLRELLDQGPGFAGVSLVRRLPDGRYQLLDGHLRASEMGVQRVPCAVLDLNDREAEQFLLTYDPLAALATADTTKVDALRDRVKAAGAQVAKLIAGLPRTKPSAREDADELPPAPDDDKVITQPGDLWILGEHRLVCGDATDANLRSRVLDGLEVDVVFTDPPYGVEYVSRVDKDRRKEWGPIANDHLTGDALVALVAAAVPEARARYVCASHECVGFFRTALGDPKSVCVWVKGHFGLGKGYRRQHELVMFYGVLNRTDLSDVWRFERAEQYQHPTQKPVALIMKALADCDAVNVFDPFCGSGSTLIAAEQLGRPCRAIELSPVYVDVAVARWEGYTGRRAERVPAGGGDAAATDSRAR